MGNAPMRTKPTPQERPEAFHRVHVHFAKAVPIFIAGKLASPMVDTLMVVSPDMQASINAILVCINKCTWKDGCGLTGFVADWRLIKWRRAFETL